METALTEQAAAGIDHGPAQLVQQQPGALVAPQPQLRLQLQGGVNGARTFPTPQSGEDYAAADRAETPFEWLVRMWTAVNQVFSGRWDRCITVPAVTEVCLPQAAHSRVKRLPLSAQLRVSPQAGQTKPSGHRRAAR